MSETNERNPEQFSPLDDASRNSNRRSLRPEPREKQLAKARAAQEASGVHIRVYRKVMNQRDFREQLSVWRQPHQAGIAKRNGLGSFAVSVFDTKQQPLENCPTYSQSSLEELLRNQQPGLFQPTPPIEVVGIRLYGKEDKYPHIGLKLAPSPVPIYQEKLDVQRTIAPGLKLDDSYLEEHTPHISLCHFYVPGVAEDYIPRLTGKIPDYVQLEAGRVVVEMESRQD